MANNITPAIFCKNEEYWIHYVLRDLLEIFPEVIFLDTGSYDKTIKIAKQTEKLINKGKLVLLEEQYFNNSNKIGNSPNVLRNFIDTDYMLLIGGDEIWPKDQLLKLIDLMQSNNNIEVGMALGRNVVHTASGWCVRDEFNADRLFNRDVVWHITDYPHEAHGLEQRIERGKVKYFEPYFWHVRHLQRSSEDKTTYYRSKKFTYFGKVSDSKLKKIPEDWHLPYLGFKNPYLGVVV